MVKIEKKNLFGDDYGVADLILQCSNFQISCYGTKSILYFIKISLIGPPVLSERILNK